MSHIKVHSVPGSLPKNSWQLFMSLAQGKWQPGHSWNEPAYRRKFILRSLMMPFRTVKLMKNLVSQPFLASMLTAQPGLPCRLHRPYLAVNIPRAETFEAIACHYKDISDIFSEQMIKEYFTERGYCLAELQGKNNESYSIYLSAVDMQGKEGEVTLNICDSKQVILAKLTFTICQYDNKKTLFIGGLQGAKHCTPHETIHVATKACYGLFPKRLLLETACALAGHFHAEQILAVGNSTHIYRSWRYDKKKKRLMHADYDSFWLSMHGELRKDGLFLLPAAIARKSLEDIASKKRAEYRRRYELLDNLSHSIDGHF